MNSSGPPELRVLIIEDSEDDLLLILRHLARHGYRVAHECVQTRPALAKALHGGMWDLVLSDYTLPGFSGLEALRLVQESGFDIPFILVSGAVGEDSAVMAMKAGAHDFIPKSNLARLVPAIERELREVASRKQKREAEKSLAESESRFRVLAENAQDIIYRIRLHPQPAFEYVSPAVQRILGYSSDEFYGAFDLFLQLVHPDDSATIRSLAVSPPLFEQPLTFRICNKAGKMVWLESQLEPVRAPGGAIIAAEGVARDVTARLEAERALRESEARYRQLVEQSPDAVYLESRGRIVFVNSAAIRLFGASQAQELVGRPVMELVPEEHRFSHREHIRQLQEGESLAGVRETLQRLDGSILQVELSASLFSYEGLPAVQVVVRDLTDRLNLEAQLRHAQKMEAVGQLAAGVAHDFNNILTIIQGHLGLLKHRYSQDSGLVESLDKVTLAADRAAALTRQLLTFSHKQRVQMAPVQLNNTITTFMNMLQRALGEEITVQFFAAPDLPLVEADNNMLEQIVMNLAVNARDAMPKGGTLTIKTHAQEISAEYVRHHPSAKKGLAVCLTLQDTGCGMDPQTLSRIFEPFFTTKEVGKGTGLGLATVYAIVEHHRGWIEVDSRPDQGTTFRIFLPGLARFSEEGYQGVDEKQVPEKGHERVLLVEDEPGVLELASQVLQQYGYQVVTARSGREALLVWEAQRNQIQLLISDIVMPDGVSGIELAEQLKNEKRDLKVILTSGYSAGEKPLPVPASHFLEKPYPPGKLLQLVRRVLDEQLVS